jgi:hypothetical protein
MCIQAFVEAVCLFYDLVICGRGHRNAGGSCSEGDGQPSGVVTNDEFRSPSIVH